MKLTGSSDEAAYGSVSPGMAASRRYQKDGQVEEGSLDVDVSDFHDLSLHPIGANIEVGNWNNYLGGQIRSMASELRGIAGIFLNIGTNSNASHTFHCYNSASSSKSVDS